MLIFLLVLTIQAYASLLPLQNEYSHTRSLSQCLVRAVDRRLGEGELVIVVISSFKSRLNTTADFENMLLEDLSKANHVSYMVKKVANKNIYPGPRKHVGAYIIHLRRLLGDIQGSLKLLSTEEDFNPHAIFFIVSTSTFEISSTVSQYIAEVIWDFRLVNVIGLFSEDYMNGTYDVYGARLYEGCGYSIAPYVLDQCINGVASNRNDWFNDKIPNNLNGCQLYVRTTVIEPFVISTETTSHSSDSFNFTEGLEIKLINTIGKYLNLNINYSITQSSGVYGRIFQNSTITGSYLDLMNKEIDLIVGYVISRPETQQIFDTISSYFQDSLVFCVAHAKLLEDWVKVRNNVWNFVMLLTIISYVALGTVICRVSRSRSAENARYKTFSGVSMRIFSVLYGVALDYLPKTDLNRFLIILGITCAFFYRSINMTYSFKSLVSVEWGYQIHTEEEIASKILQYYPLCLDYFQSHDLTNIKLELCEDYAKCLNKTAVYDQYATCMPKLNVQYLFHKYLDEQGYPRLYYLNRNIVTYPIEMLMWKGHPLKPKINELVNRLSAGGFIYKWEKEIFDGLLLSMKTKNFVPNNNIVVRISHLITGFGIVLVAQFISILVFVGEIFVYKREIKKQQAKLA